MSISVTSLGQANAAPEAADRIISFDQTYSCIGYMSQPNHDPKTIQLQSKALFVSQTKCEIYDFNTQVWEAVTLSMPRRGISVAATNSQAFLAGGEVLPGKYTGQIDIYNYKDKTWRTTRLSEPRKAGASIAIANKAFFAGGKNEKGFSKRVDVFNTVSNKRTIACLSQARDNMAVAVAGSKIIFAGGETGIIQHPQSSNIIDIYDVSSNKWSTALLSSPRHKISVATAGNKIFFAGGLTHTEEGGILSDKVDIYDIATSKWTSYLLTEAKYDMAVAVANSKVYFAGGITNKGLTNKVEVYDVSNDNRYQLTLPVARTGMAAGTTNQHIMFAGGFEKDMAYCSNRIEVLDIPTEQLTVERLFEARNGLAAAPYNNNIVFAGGSYSTNLPKRYLGASATVDIYREIPRVRYISSALSKNNNKQGIFSISQRDLNLHIDLLDYQLCNVTVNIVNDRKQVVKSIPFLPIDIADEPINLSGLPNGCYWIIVESTGFKPVISQLKIQDKLKDYVVK